MLAYAQHLRKLAAVDRAIRAGDYPNSVGPAELLAVDRQTIHRYFAFLRQELKAPLRFHHERNGYYYGRAWRFDRALLAPQRRTDVTWPSSLAGKGTGR